MVQLGEYLDESLTAKPFAAVAGRACHMSLATS